MKEKIVQRWTALYALVLAFCAPGLGSLDTNAQGNQQGPDQDGIYFVGPQVSTPQLLHVALAAYPRDVPRESVQGMSVFAMVITSGGTPDHLELLHSHGVEFDRSAESAIRACTFAPGRLHAVPVPVWIDVRVVFRKSLEAARPEILITERDLPVPTPKEPEETSHRSRSYTPPIPIHTVDADFANPFVRHPYVQVAIVNVLVDQKGLPREIRLSRGLGFGLDQKAIAAVRHYRFVPATKNGKPIEARRDIEVTFSKF